MNNFRKKDDGANFANIRPVMNFFVEGGGAEIRSRIIRHFLCVCETNFIMEGRVREKKISVGEGKYLSLIHISEPTRPY